jgi:hypothetical protein
MRWLVRFYEKQIYHTHIEAASREEAEAELLLNQKEHADEFNHFGSEVGVIGIREDPKK